MKKKELLKQLREKDVAALQAELKQASEELMRTRFKAVTGPLEKSHVLRELRRRVATIATIVSEKSAAA